MCGTPLPEPLAAAVDSPRRDDAVPLAAASALVMADAASAPLPSPPPPGLLGARREVTVVFVDITNFTAASRTLDSEEVFVWMDETMRALAAVIDKYEGTIDKFTGDGLMALFGAPSAHENDPERAVRAALDMQDAVQPLRERVKDTYNIDFRVRIGVNTGLVIAGNVGGDTHAEYTVLGDTVNLASRLEKAAEPGTVLVSAETYLRTRPIFNYQSLPPLTVKGVPHPLQTYRPLGLLAQPGPVRGIPGLQAPMIGRADDLERVCTALAQVRHDRRNHVVLITGEAGLGKSRLVVEFRKSMPAIAPDAAAETRFYEGACFAHTRSTPLWVVADILRNVLRLSGIDPVDVQRERLYTYLAGHGLASDEVLPYLNNVLGLGQTDPAIESRLRVLDAAVLQRQTHAALRQIFLAEAALAPTVLVFDDLHWVDPASRELIEYLIQTTLDAPLLLLMVSRESERATVVRPLIAAAEQNPDRLIDIQLQALSADEGRLLVDQLIRQTSDDAIMLTARIAERASGNPFYIEELIRMLIEQGGLNEEDGAWISTPRAEALFGEVPGTLKGLILARFDRLSEHMRQTLQKAGVLGRSFPISLLRMFDGADHAVIDADLNELESRHFLVVEPFGPEGGYAFRHSLIQDAVYGTLLKRDRQKLHEQAAQTIERGAFWPPDEQTEVLAYHYAESTRPDKAIPLLIVAAENAARRYANETAIQHYRRTIGLMQEYPAHYGDAVFRVRVGLGQALKFIGKFTEAGQILEEALQRLQIAAIDPAAWLSITAEVLGELADVRLREGAPDKAVTHLEAGLKTLGPDGGQSQPTLWRSLMHRLAFVRLRQGDLEQAFALASAATENLHPEQVDDPLTLANLYSTLGGVLCEQGKLAEGIQYVERSLDLYKNLGYSWGMANAYTNLGILYYAKGDWQRAVENLERSDVLRREIGYIPNLASNLKNLGLLRMAMGDHTQARIDLENSLSMSQRLGDDFGIVCAQIGLGLLAVIQARFTEARTHVEAAMRHLDAAGEAEAIQTRWLLALIEAEIGDPQKGLDYALYGLEMARATGLSEQETECLRVLGRLYTNTGQYLEAQSVLRTSIDLCRQRNDPYQQGLALFEIGCLYERLAIADLNSRDEWQSLALAAYHGAAALFESLGAAYDLRLTQEALDRLPIDAPVQKRPGILRQLNTLE